MGGFIDDKKSRKTSFLHWLEIGAVIIIIIIASLIGFGIFTGGRFLMSDSGKAAINQIGPALGTAAKAAVVA